MLDFETTGFSPAKHDRVVEIGVVQVDAWGAIQDHWSTLVNPERDIGASHVHGITAADVLTAPTFRQVVPRLLSSIAGRTVVAHNARFDMTFLVAELVRAGYPLVDAVPCLCTMEWSSRFLEGTSRKLGDCCRLAGVASHCGHSAEADAMAAAGLLAHYLRAAGDAVPWLTLLGPAEAFAWPTCAEVEEVMLVQRATSPAAPDAWLDQVTSKADRVADPLVESYVDVLEHALLDGFLSAHEKHDLVEIGESLGLERAQLDRVHRTYVSALAAAAWADGVVTMEEQFQLSQVAASLGVPQAVAKQILVDAQGERPAFTVPTLQLSAGDRIVFTGDLGTPREAWVERITDLGLECGGVTKSTRAVVAADPDSLSGKAAKARKLGIPIVTEFAFEAIIGQMEAHRRARSRALADE
ncbi:MAG: exonuclease domain-containing protein [Nocardioidaceae bacterium]